MGNANPNTETFRARVSAVHRDYFSLMIDHTDEVTARLKTAAYRDLTKNPLPVTGDWVEALPNPDGDARIVRTLQRHSVFMRSDFSGHALDYAKTVKAQAVAANFDDVLIVDSLNLNLSTRRISRYLILVRESGARPIIVLTKADLQTDYQKVAEDMRAISGGAPVHAVSAHAGIGLEEVRGYFSPGRVIALLGSSGVGKSSLINALAGKELMRVNSIREDDAKGRHTTTHRQMLRMPGGALCIDTPGMRELGMWDAEEGLSETFAPVLALMENCRFRNCTHTSEPGCAVRKAIQAGQLSQETYDQYRALQREARHARAHAPAAKR